MALRKEATILETGRALKSHSFTTSAGRGRLSLPWHSGQCNRPVYSQRRGACVLQRAVSRTVHRAEACTLPSLLSNIYKTTHYDDAKAEGHCKNCAQAEIQPLLTCHGGLPSKAPQATWLRLHTL